MMLSTGNGNDPGLEYDYRSFTVGVADVGVALVIVGVFALLAVLV